MLVGVFIAEAYRTVRDNKKQLSSLLGLYKCPIKNATQGWRF
jgi:hypothetical protein